MLKLNSKTEGSIREISHSCQQETPLREEWELKKTKKKERKEEKVKGK